MLLFAAFTLHCQCPPTHHVRQIYGQLVHGRAPSWLQAIQGSRAPLITVSHRLSHLSGTAVLVMTYRDRQRRHLLNRV